MAPFVSQVGEWQRPADSVGDCSHMFDHVDKDNNGKQMKMVEKSRRAVRRRNEKGFASAWKTQVKSSWVEWAI